MYGVPDSPPAAAGGGNPNPNVRSAGGGGGGGSPSGLSPPAAPSGEAAAAAAGRSPSSPSSSPRRPGDPPGGGGGGGSSLYDLLRTAVGLTPRGLAADAFSPHGSAEQAEEEDFWSANEEGGEDSAGAGADNEYRSSSSTPAVARPRTSAGAGAGAATVTSTGLGAGGGERRLSEARQFPVTTNGEIVSRASGAATRTGAHSRPGERPTSRARQQLLSEAEADIGRRFPGGGPDVQAGSSSLEAAATAVAGTARRRIRLFGSNTAAASESEPRPPGSRPPSAAAAAAASASTSTSTSRVLNSRGNPLFRLGDRGSGSFWRPTTIAGNATFDDEDDEEEGDEEEDLAAGAGTRAVERAINAASSAPTAAVAGGEANGGPPGRSASRRGGSRSLDASERGEGGGGGGGGDGSGTSGQGRILFYHKPTLANVPAGDVPDVVPVYLGCPRGNMALGLPLNEAWQGEEHQDTTFNQNLSYTILSWPEDHVQDLLELWRLQVLFFATTIFNVLLSALLFFTDNPDRTRVEGFARVGAFPGPFQQRAYADDPTGLRSEEWHLAAAFLLSVLGMVCVLARLRAGIALYLVLTVVNAVVGLGQSPDPLFACRYAVDVVLVAMGRSFLSSLTYTWVTASAGDGRRGL